MQSNRKGASEHRIWIQAQADTGRVGAFCHHTYPALVVLYSTFRIGLHGSVFFPSLGCFPVRSQEEQFQNFIESMLSTHDMPWCMPCVCMHVCVRQLLPCGVMICAGLAGTRIFHVVRVPSEWLQTNCFPSWCQATEWIA